MLQVILFANLSKRVVSTDLMRATMSGRNDGLQDLSWPWRVIRAGLKRKSCFYKCRHSFFNRATIGWYTAGEEIVIDYCAGMSEVADSLGRLYCRRWAFQTNSPFVYIQQLLSVRHLQRVGP